MGVYVPNIEKPKEAVDVEVIFRDSDGYIMGHELYCTLIEIDDIQYKAFLEFNEKLIKKLEEHILYGERRADEHTD